MKGGGCHLYSLPAGISWTSISRELDSPSASTLSLWVRIFLNWCGQSSFRYHTAKPDHTGRLPRGSETAKPSGQSAWQMGEIQLKSSSRVTEWLGKEVSSSDMGVDSGENNGSSITKGAQVDWHVFRSEPRGFPRFQALPAHRVRSRPLTKSDGLREAVFATSRVMSPSLRRLTRSYSKVCI